MFDDFGLLFFFGNRWILRMSSFEMLGMSIVFVSWPATRSGQHMGGQDFLLFCFSPGNLWCWVSWAVKLVEGTSWKFWHATKTNMSFKKGPFQKERMFVFGGSRIHGFETWYLFMTDSKVLGKKHVVPSRRGWQILVKHKVRQVFFTTRESLTTLRGLRQW